MDLQQLKYIYFLGIGGIGMSALARWFKANGYEVGGYDLTQTSLTDQLEEEKISIHFEDNVNSIPKEFLSDKSKTLIVYTPAVPKNHSELNYFQSNGFEVKKRSAVLGFLTQNLFTIAVAGTHGKTTTSSMVAHILTFANKNVTAFLGGITQNYGSNMLVNKNGLTDVMVVAEADEYDRSFLTLYPNLAIITSIDPDHLDIYGNFEEIQKSFQDFISQIKKDGKLFIKKGLNIVPINKEIEIFEYSIKEDAAFKAENIRTDNGQFTFNFIYKTGSIKNIALGVPGFHNVENATAAIAIALSVGIDEEIIKSALVEFRGVKRRFDYIIKTENKIYIDDYAHHPAEIEAFLKSVKALYPNRKITAIFQPHLFTRTRDFAPAFSESLSIADELILLDIYPARELPIEGVTSEIIFKNVTLKNKVLINKNDLIKTLEGKDLDVLVTIGAGDIDKYISEIKNLITDSNTN